MELRLGRRATSLDLRSRRLTDDRGAEVSFDKLLLATGGTPRRLPFGGDEVIYFRSLEDYRRLRKAAVPGATCAVIGGGFIGSEIAAALTLQGCKVVMFFPEDGIGARAFPAELSAFLVEYYRDRGVEVDPGDTVTGIHRRGAQLLVESKRGVRLTVDAVVAGVGVRPNTDLAEAAGLAVDNGIVVNHHLRTSHPGAWAAGDVASFIAPALGTRLRVQHEDNAVTMGRAVGRAMAGIAAPYIHLPSFYSDLFDLGYEAVGLHDPRGEIVADWKVPFREGVVYYMANGRVRGVLLWNTWGQVDAARALIAEAGPFTAESLTGRLPA